MVEPFQLPSCVSLLPFWPPAQTLVEREWMSWRQQVVFELLGRFPRETHLMQVVEVERDCDVSKTKAA